MQTLAVGHVHLSTALLHAHHDLACVCGYSFADEAEMLAWLSVFNQVRVLVLST
jgi:hypothetical protein